MVTFFLIWKIFISKIILERKVYELGEGEGGGGIGD